MCLLFNPVNFVCQDIAWLWFYVLRPRQPRYRRLAPRWKALRCSYPAGSLVWPDEAHDFPLKIFKNFVKIHVILSHFLFFLVFPYKNTCKLFHTPYTYVICKKSAINVCFLPFFQRFCLFSGFFLARCFIMNPSIIRTKDV